MMIIDGILSLSWALVFGTLARAMGKTTFETCNVYNWGSSDGIRVCHMYKMLFAFTALLWYSRTIPHTKRLGRLTIVVGCSTLDLSHSPPLSVVARRSMHMRRLSTPPTCIPRRLPIILRTVRVVPLMAHRHRPFTPLHLTILRARTHTMVRNEVGME